MGKIVKNGIEYSIGAPGAPGTPGVNGVGVPDGGLTGQILQKVSDSDYDTEWVTPSGGGGGLDFDHIVRVQEFKSVSYDSSDSNRYIRKIIRNGDSGYAGSGTIDFVNNDYYCVLSATGRFEVLSNDDSYDGTISCNFIKPKNQYKLIPVGGGGSGYYEPIKSSILPEITGVDSSGVLKKMIVNGPSTHGTYLNASSTYITVYIPWSHLPPSSDTNYSLAFEIDLIPIL